MTGASAFADSERHFSQHMRLWYLSYCRLPKAQANADSAESSLLVYITHKLPAQDFGTVITLTSDEGSGEPVQICRLARGEVS